MEILNNQKPQPLDRKENGVINVHSVFETIQGEGPFAGNAATFIRLVGCNLQCPFCDTEYTSKSIPTTPSGLVEQLQLWYTSKLIVITGGEPFRQNITRAVKALLAAGYIVQIETNGVLYPGDDFPWEAVTVVCSPKTGKIHPKTATRVDAYKYVLAWGGVAPDGLPKQALGHPLGGHSTVARPPEGWDGPIYLQPMDAKNPFENKRNMDEVVRSVMVHKRYIAGVQMHKIMDLP